MSMRVSQYSSVDVWSSSSFSTSDSFGNGIQFASQTTFEMDQWDIDSGPPAASPSKSLSRGSLGTEFNQNDMENLLLTLMQLLSQIINMLGMQDQGDAPPKVEGKGGGQGGGCGSHSDAGKHRHPSWDYQDRSDYGSSGKDRSKEADRDSKTRPGGGGSTSRSSGPGSMPEPTGTQTVNQTIVVKAGEVFDGGGKLFKAGPSLGDGGQSEGQKPIFQIEPGGVLKNLQYEGADGIHTMGDATIQDVWARDVGEDAMTMKKPGNVTWSGGGAFNATDKIFQLNAGGSFTLENFTADNFGKAIRTNGGHNIDTDIVVRNSHFTNGKESIVRTDATAATITLDGVTFSNVPNDVLAPNGTRVVGAVQRSQK